MSTPERAPIMGPGLHRVRTEAKISDSRPHFLKATQFCLLLVAKGGCKTVLASRDKNRGHREAS